VAQHVHIAYILYPDYVEHFGEKNEIIVRKDGRMKERI